MKEQASQTNKIAADTPTSSRRPMKVLFCASECVPFVKTGGLADVFCIRENPNTDTKIGISTGFTK